MTTRDLLQEGYEDLGILAPGQTMPAEMTTFGLSKLTRLLDNFNAERAAVYATRFQTYTLIPGTQPHTIGPTGSPSFTVTQRPVSIEAANLVLTDVSPAVHRPLYVTMDAQEWSRLTVPTLTTSIPTVLYYQPEWVQGKLYLWPVPDTAYGLELFTRIVLADLALGDTLSFPPGYRDAITLTWEEMVAPSYPPAQADTAAAAHARARIMANNDVIPSLATRDAGMPGQSHRGVYFSWRTGMNI